MTLRRNTKANARADDSIARKREKTKRRTARTALQAGVTGTVALAAGEALDATGVDWSEAPNVRVIGVAVIFVVVTFGMNKLEDWTGMTLPGVLSDGENLEVGAPRSKPEDLPETPYPGAPK